MTIVAAALAALVGLTLGLLGGGGAILTVPIFAYVLGFPAKMAVAMSLPVVGAASLAGAVGHWRAGNVDLGRALPFGALAMVGAYGGARLAAFVSGAVQMSLLAVVMLAAAGAMLRRRDGRTAMPPGDAVDSKARLTALMPVALGVGLLTGLVGVGGGFLIVPALVLMARMPMTTAVGTSLVVIAMNSAAGIVGHVGQVEVPWAFVAAFTGVAIAGILGGTRLSARVPQVVLRRAFAVLLVGMGAMLLHQNRGVFSASPIPQSAVTR